VRGKKKLVAVLALTHPEDFEIIQVDDDDDDEEEDNDDIEIIDVAPPAPDADDEQDAEFLRISINPNIFEDGS